MDRFRTAGGALAALILMLALAACGTTTASATADETADATASAEATASASATEPEEGDDDDDGGGEATNTVSMANNQFSPRSLTVAAGTTVTFTNTGGHTVTEGSSGAVADDPIVNETGGADIEVTFDEPGTYPITCRIHPNMNMTITVEG